MNLLILSPTVDTAGLGIGLKRAFDRFGGDWKARHVRCANSWLDYPRDIQWDRNDPAQTAEVMALWAQADAVLIMEMPFAAGWFPTPKPLIVYHLGTYFRKQPNEIRQQCARLGALECVDMHELMRFGVREWLPDIIDPAPLAAIRGQFRLADPHPVRIVHAPTDRIVKSTDIVVGVVERLAKEYPIEFDLVEKVPNDECLVRKASADIFIDELTYGYGLNALECWSMGIPVISGIADAGTRALMEQDFGRLPFYHSTPETLYEHVEELVVSPQARRDWSARGLWHLDRFHSPQAVVAKTIELARRKIG